MRAVSSVSFVLTVVCLLTGCAATPGGPILAGTLKAGPVSVTDDPFQPYVEFKADEVVDRRYLSGMVLQLIGRREKKSGRKSIFLFLSVHYIAHSRRNYHMMRNLRTKALPVRKMARSRACRKADPCAQFEEIAVDLPLAELRAAPQSGYMLKLFSKEGRSFPIVIPKATILSLLDKMDE